MTILKLRAPRLRNGRVRKAHGRWTVMVFGSVLGIGIAGGSPGASGDTARGTHFCQAASPAALTSQPARWLGDCGNGLAEGLGVMRAGSAEPYQFFFGEMHAGSPVRGMLKEGGGWEMAARFDAARVAVSPRSWTPEASHAMYVLAARAAQTAARQFASVGNRSSEAYYERLAQDITKGEPE